MQDQPKDEQTGNALSEAPSSHGTPAAAELGAHAPGVETPLRQGEVDPLIKWGGGGAHTGPLYLPTGAGDTREITTPS